MIDLNLLPTNIGLSRKQRLNKIQSQDCWDIIVIGGGITGAGIFKLASELGLNVLLVEQKDFAWGSSSRSSKMVHGGLRYAAQGQFKLTKQSVQERQRLLNDAPYLVTEQSFALSHYQGKFPPPWLFNSLLFFYDHLSGKKQHHYWAKQAYQFIVPQSNSENSLGGTQFCDAMVDDARMVLRLIQEGQQLGGLAINYSQVQHLLFDEQQRVCGIKLAITTEQNQIIKQVKSRWVINATGAWAKQLLASTKQNKAINIRPLRGSHIIVPSWRLPVATAVSVIHPLDGRPVQIYPWHNVTVIGTTDVEHYTSLLNEPKISKLELDYLLHCIAQEFPQANISEKDIISTYAGVRPVIADKHLGKIDPSKEKRDHSIWQQAGLITVAGGKLTTFYLIAKQVLECCIEDFVLNKKSIDFPAFLPITAQCDDLPIAITDYQFLLGCYGQLANIIKDEMITKQKFAERISSTPHLWGQLWWAANYEQVEHLDDLLLRRTRLGNVLAQGGMALLDEIKMICEQGLAWSEEYWQQEIIRYQQLWKNSYSIPKEC